MSAVIPSTSLGGAIAVAVVGATATYLMWPRHKNKRSHAPDANDEALLRIPVHNIQRLACMAAGGPQVREDRPRA